MNSIISPPASPTVSSPSRLQPRGRGLLISANFRTALKALRANQLRSFLTTLGVIIGVAAVIAIVTLTQGVSATLNQRLAGLGTNVLMIQSGSASRNGAFQGEGTAQTLTTSDVQALSTIPHVANISPVISVGAQAIYGSRNWNTQVLGVYPSYQSLQNWQLARGTWFSTGDQVGAAPVAVIGQTVVDNLFTPAGIDPIGQTIRINNQLFRVVGTLQSKGSSGFGNADDVIFVPSTAAQDRLKNSLYVDQIQIQVDSSTNVAQVQQNVTTILEKQHHIAAGATDDFRVLNANQLLQTAQQTTTLLTALLVGIAAISLTVGGIGIMNIMLVSVTERIREIGIRMAVGARRSDIRNQFLIEAVVLSAVGGVIGILIGLLAGLGISAALGLPLVVSPLAILIAFGVAAIIGIGFGLYPAVRAARLDPIVALRTE
jgi:putative ABC transport system permease protein